MQQITECITFSIRTAAEVLCSVISEDVCATLRFVLHQTSFYEQHLSSHALFYQFLLMVHNCALMLMLLEI
jgi:hypothetical protein